MKDRTNSRIGHGIAVALLAAIGTTGAAQAGWTDQAGEGGISTPGYFSNFGSGGRSPEIDMSMYDKVNLGPLSSSVYAPKAGAQGPLRDKDAEVAAAQLRDIEARLGPVGGRNTQ